MGVIADSNEIKKEDVRIWTFSFFYNIPKDVVLWVVFAISSKIGKKDIYESEDGLGNREKECL